MRAYWIGLLVLLINLPVEAQIYRWVDSSGQVHFSDQPRKGAEKVDLPPVQTYSPPETKDNNNEAKKEDSDKEDESTSASYSIKIVQPVAESTLRNNQGLVPVVVELDPQLRETDEIQLVYDGKPMGKPQNTPTFTLTNVYRGSHTVAVQVLSEDGTVINESEPVTFFMHRPRINMGNVPVGGR